MISPSGLKALKDAAEAARASKRAMPSASKTLNRVIKSNPVGGHSVAASPRARVIRNINKSRKVGKARAGAAMRSVPPPSRSSPVARARNGSSAAKWVVAGGAAAVGGGAYMGHRGRAGTSAPPGGGSPSMYNY